MNTADVSIAISTLSGTDGWHELCLGDGTPINVDVLIDDGRAVRLSCHCDHEAPKADLLAALAGYGLDMDLVEGRIDAGEWSAPETENVVTLSLV